ncbi:hypothetical protein QR680_005870 [Steinernema hermaphroditum]|uniref:Carboxylic ester hydrolase n=1 Tax=Steinernema hermaphroditum TaxID=289476 RepID=A0AA39HVV5_9BILA|nr:hypothetical protein QR680_005870 [Steinernema hermaphroditum]
MLTSWLGALFLISFADARTFPIVETNYGKVQGFTTHLMSGGLPKANVFLGIPYAAPPEGDLRFKKPVEPEGWIDVLETRKFAPTCVPHHRDAIVGPISEDCLYLNIMTPERESKDPEGYPVLFWVHGGGYCLGAANIYGYQNVSDNFVSKGIIVVTIQYRLGPLGFLSTGDGVLPGNLGLWDQAAALKYVYENIANFGGNPKKITVWGLSAGGSSVQQLSISPVTRDYVHQSIEMSGSAFAEWATSDRVVGVSRDLAANMGCPLESEAMLKCMSTKSVDEILDGVDRTGPTRYDLNIVKYGPRIDGDFFPIDYERLVEESPQRPAIIGMTAKESTFFTILGFSKTINTLYLTRENFANFDRESLVTFIRETVAPEKVAGVQAKELQERLVKFYVERDEPEEADYKFYLERYTDLCSDAQFNIPILLGAQLKRKSGWPVFLYLHEYFNEALYQKGDPAVGSTHANELYPMFGLPVFGQLEMTEAEKKNQKMIVDAFARFVKTGNPSTKDIEWLETDATNPLRYLSFDAPEPKMNDALMSEAFSFWTELWRDFDYDVMRGTYKSTNKPKDEL